MYNSGRHDLLNETPNTECTERFLVNKLKKKYWEEFLIEVFRVHLFQLKHRRSNSRKESLKPNLQCGIVRVCEMGMWKKK